jgi:hypothetical protein
VLVHGRLSLPVELPGNDGTPPHQQNSLPFQSFDDANGMIDLKLPLGLLDIDLEILPLKMPANNKGSSIHSFIYFSCCQNNQTNVLILILFI